MGLLVCLVPVKQALAIDPNWLMSQYIRDHWGARGGFPGGQVYAITQTPDGYLWIGAEQGLVRFDGVSFRLIQDNSGKINIRRVLGLTPDRDGSLWIRLEDEEGVVRYRDGIFDHPGPELQSPLSRITVISRTTQGELLASQPESGTVVFRHGRFETLFEGAGLPRSPILALAETNSGAIYVGTRDAGLFRLATGRSERVGNIPDPKVNCLLADGQQGLWVGTDNGLFRWDGKKFDSAGIPQVLNHFQALALAKDSDGNLWIGTDSKGLLRLNRGGLSFPSGVDREKSAITSVFEDRERNIWAGTAEGVERLRDSAFVTYSSAEGLPSSNNGPIYVDTQGRTWFAPSTGGLYWLEKGKATRFLAEGLSDVIYSITGDSTGLWLGRQQGGLTHLAFAGRQVRSKEFTTSQGLAEDTVIAVEKDRDGTIWAGTITGGVSRLKDGHFATYTTADGLVSNTVLAITQTRDGARWFATPKGLSELSQNGWRIYTPHDGLPSENVDCIFQDSAGMVWVGTSSGLAFFSRGAIHRLSGAPPSLQEQVLGLAEDQKGSIWIATSRQVLRVNRAKLDTGTLAIGDVREYGAADGLTGTGALLRNRSVYADAQGRVWFSLNGGISVVDPNRVAGAPSL